MTHAESDGRQPDLRPLIARLKEIERKCESMGTRNEEFLMMQEKLSSIISRLEAGEEFSGLPLSYRALSQELFPVAHLFESVGFMSVGKEISHVERALKALEPEAVSPAAPIDPAQSSATIRGAVEGPDDPAIATASEEVEIEEEVKRRSVPKPLLVWFFILLVAIATALAIILRTGPFASQVLPPPTPSSVLLEPIATSAPPSPTTPPHNSIPTPTTRERFSEALSQARLSFARHDIDEALKYLSIAALADRHDTSVVEFANEMVDRLLEDANEAANGGYWEEATSLLAEARVVAKRFDLRTLRMDAAEQRFAEMQRYRIVEPGDTEALRAAIGETVEIVLDDGNMVRGRIVAVDGTYLSLEVEDDVGGGIVRFGDAIALSTIRWIRIWED